MLWCGISSWKSSTGAKIAELAASSATPCSPQSYFSFFPCHRHKQDSHASMTVSSTHPVDEYATESSSGRPVKRMKTATSLHLPNRSNDPEEDDTVTSVRRHPLGVRPSGNAYTSSVNLKDSCGLFATLPDELITQILEVLEPQDLLRLGGTCRALHAFTRNDELWRALFVE